MPAVFLKSITDLAYLPPGNKPHVALIGRSNVGKSSLVNRLVNHKGLARVSATPGHTQTINFYEVDGRYFLVDLPGYGFVHSGKDRRTALTNIVHDYVEHAHPILVFLIIDARLGPTDADRAMQEMLADTLIPTVMILNKMDKLTREQSNKLVRTLTEKYPNMKLLPHSINESKDRGEIMDVIERAVRAA